MTNIAEIKVGSRVTACGGLVAKVIGIKGRWVKVQFVADGTEKNVGFKDVSPLNETTKAADPKKAAARAAKHACPTTCPECGSKELWAGRNVKGVVVDEDKVWGCHHCDWSNVPKNGIVAGEARRRYQTTKVGDVVCVDNGDPVATALRGLDINDVFKIAADVLQTTQKELHAKYDHLNVGQQRMNLGNRLRKAVRQNPANLKFIR